MKSRVVCRTVVSLILVAVAHAHAAPPNSENLVLWLKADSLRLADGAPVSNWVDASTAAHNATQGVAASQPTFVVSGINGIPAVRFDGANHFLSLDRIAPPGGLSVFLVFRSSNNNATASYEGNSPATLIGDNSGNACFSFGLAGGSLQFNLDVKNVWRHWNEKSKSNDSLPHVVAFTHSNVGGQLDRVFKDADLVASSSYAFSTAAVGVNRIGGGYNSINPGSGTNDLFRGDISEVIVYGAVLSDDDRRAVIEYLMKKFGVSALKTVESPAASPTPEIPIAYTLPRDGKVSLAIYDNQQRQVRTLLAGVPQAAGKHQTTWDGLDREGHPMAIGSYTWKLLQNEGLEADFVTLLGQNAPSPPWTSWMGNHIGPTFVAAGAKGRVYVGVSFSEANNSLLALASDDGPILWKFSTAGNGGPTDLAEIGDTCVVLNNNNFITRYNAATGAALGPAIDVCWAGDKRETYATGVKQPGFLFDGGSALRIAADGTSLVIAYRDHDALRWIDPSTGKMQRTAAVKHPTAIATGANGIIYAISGSDVVAVSRDGAVATIVGSGAIVAPSALAYDGANNQLLVADRGAAQQIHRFTADGKPIRIYGREGGRLDGEYVATDFLDVTDMAGDGSGGFFALEPDGVRRIMHIRADGSVAKQRLGGTPFNTVASADPLAPREVWYNASDTTLAKVDLDVDAGLWNLRETYTYLPGKTFGSGLFPGLDVFPIWRVRRHAGDPATYLIHESPAAVMRVDSAARKLVPVALAWHKTGANSGCETLLAAMANQGMTYTSPDSDAFTWSDTNGNGQIDPAEFRFYKEAAGMSFKFATFDANMNIYIGYSERPFYDYDGHHYLYFDFQDSAYVKLPNLGKSPGALIWDWSRLERSKAKVPADLRDRNSMYITKSIHCDAQGAVTLYMLGQGSDRHDVGWPINQVNSSYLLRALPNGTISWTASKHNSPGMPDPTMIGMPAYLPGATHGCIVAIDHNASYGATVWTEDGLYAGTFLDRHVNDVPDWCYQVSGHYYDSLTPLNDWSCGGSLTDLSDGSVMWYPPGIGRVAAYRIRGWDDWYRSSGEVKVTATSTAAPTETTATSGLTATYFRGADFAGEPIYRGVNTCLWFSSIAAKWEDGRVVDWSAGPCAGINAGEPFSARWVGRIVAPFGEDFWIRVYNRFIPNYIPLQDWKDDAGFVRVWLDGILVIDRAKRVIVGGPSETRPLRLEAGRSYDLKIEYAFPGGPGAEFSLCWASNTKESQRIPPAFLRTDASSEVPTVHVITVEANAAEQGQKPGRVRFALDAPARQNLNVRYHVDGSADSRDYSPLSGVAVIPAGERSCDVVLSPVDDTIVEGNESVRFVLNPDTNYRGDGTAGEAIVTILDNDNRVTEGLVAYYPMDESPVSYPTPASEGWVVHDCAGVRNGSIVTSWGGAGIPTPRWMPTGGRLGGAIEFFDQPSRVQLPDPGTAGKSFTFSLWICTAQPDVTFVTPVHGVVGPTCFLKSGRAGISLNGSMLGPDGPRIDDNAWHHVALTWDRATNYQSLFVDGKGLSQAKGPANAAMAEMYLGTGHSSTEASFIGKIDDLRIYDCSLDQREISILAHLVTLPARP